MRQGGHGGHRNPDDCHSDGHFRRFGGIPKTRILRIGGRQGSAPSTTIGLLELSNFLGCLPMMVKWCYNLTLTFGGEVSHETGCT